jgi:hypothetical protein
MESVSTKGEKSNITAHRVMLETIGGDALLMNLLLTAMIGPRDIIIITGAAARTEAAAILGHLALGVWVGRQMELHYLVSTVPRR